MPARSVLVTGGNAGIGKALCKQLAAEDGLFVFLGSRNSAKGAAALKDIVSDAPSAEGKIQVVQLDVTDDASVAAAANTVKASLGDGQLYGLVNNAGAGLGHEGLTGADVINVNWKGPQRVVKAFLPLLNPTEARVVNLGSGAGPMHVRQLSDSKKKLFCTCPPSIEALEEEVSAASKHPSYSGSGMPVYSLTKACLSAWTMLLAKEHPSITWSCVSPGFIDTAMTSQFGASKPPEEGTLSTRHCLFKPLDGNGWFYGSDCLRSPYHTSRNPGEPAYNGVPP